MNPKEHPSKTPSPRTGFFALLSCLLGIKGTSASKITQGTGPSSVRRPGRTFHPFSRLKCCVPVLLCAVVGALAFTAAPALAAAPETPEGLTASAVTATTATIGGVLDPKASVGGEGGFYFFVYGVSAPGACVVEHLVSEGTGHASEETLGIFAGLPTESREVDLVGLLPGSQYTFCMYARNPEQTEESISAPAAFETLPVAPEVLGESASVKSTEAVLAAQVDANSGSTECHFEYGETSVSEHKTVCEQGDALSGGQQQGVGLTVKSLKPGTAYHYRVVLKNTSGKAEGTGKPAEEEFTTVPTPTTEVPSPIGGTTATFKGKVKPLNATLTEYYFEFNRGEEAICTSEQATTPKTAGAEAVTTAVTGLEPSEKYTVCLVSVNAFGSEEASPPVHFETKLSPPAIESESTSPVQPSEGNPHPRPGFEIRLNATVNPEKEVTECHFQYEAEEEHLLAPTTALCEPGSLVGTFGGQSVGLNVGGLETGKTYYYRAVAKNDTGTELGAIEQFTLATAPETPGELEAKPIGVTTATLKGVLNPTKEGEAGTYEFAYRQSESECQKTITETVTNPFNHQPETIQRQENEKATTPGSSETESPQPVSAPLTGLHPGAPYSFCLIAHNSQGETATSSPVTFTTLPAAPTIVGEFTSGVETPIATDTPIATLNAQIEPNGAAITSYHFEYGTTAAYEHSTTAAALTGLTGTETVSTALTTGLQPGTTYHYRVVASNGLSPAGGTLGPDETFTTPGGQTTNSKECPNETRRVEQPFGQTLPDCRAYEMVSPVETGGNDATDSYIQAGRVRASEPEEKEATGEEATPAITYTSRGSFAEPDGSNLESKLLSRRNVEEGRWETRSISPLLEHDTDAGAPVAYGGVFFTPGLTEGLTATAADLSSEAPEGLVELYLATFPTKLQEPISYRLVSHLPPSEEEYAEPYQLGPGVFPLGASRDLSRVVFATENLKRIGPLREWVAGRVVSVGVSNTPSELPWTGASVGNSASSNLTGGFAYVWRAVSEDGSRVIFNHSTELYARVNVEQPQSPMKDLGLPGEECKDPAGACTVKLSAGAATYWGADTQDTKIFYVESGDLYEYKLPIGSVKGEAKPLTSGGEVQGVVQISEDGSYVYFVANGVLGDAAADGATPGNCRVSRSTGFPVTTGTECNLYVSHDGGEPTFIATLSADDGSDWLEGPGASTADLAPGKAGGAQLAFTSGESLTGYDNQQAATGECGEAENAPCSEVYLYDAETGVLTCASCDPSGARPVGPSSLATGSYGDSSNLGSSNYRPRDLLADGSLFFDSSDALVPHASDGRQNVYEYEDGHVYAISNVSGGQESFFLDASPDGQDVFFGSADKLLPEDTGDNVAVWDARADGGFPVNVSAPACTTAEACRAASPPTPGVFGTPATATFSGPGNAAATPPAVVKPKPKTAAQLKAEKLAKTLKQCAKDKKKAKRAKCQKQAKSKYGVAKKSSKSKRGGKS